MKNVLITGANGYVGSNVVKYMLKNSYNVFAVSCNNTTKLDVLKEKYENRLHICGADLLNKEDVDRLFESNNIDVVIHLAGKKSVIESESSKELYMHNNLMMTKNILNAIKNSSVKKLIFASSTAVYGNAVSVLNEKSLCCPLSPYAVSKLQCEDLIIEECGKCGVSYSILRFSNIVGGDVEDSLGDVYVGERSFLIPAILGCVILNKKLFLRGGKYKTKDGSAERDYIGMSDVCRAILLASQNEKQGIYNICSGRVYSVLKIIKMVEKIVGHKIDYEFANQSSKVEAFTSNFSAQKAKEELGFVAKEQIEKAIESQYEIFLKQIDI